MRLILASLLTFAFSITVLAHGDNHGDAKKPDANAKAFGGKMSKLPPLSLNEVIENFDKYDGKTVAFTATTKKVCEKKGCWMVVSDGKNEVRTLFKDYGFFVPSNILDKKVRVQGVMEKKKVSAATIRHFMKDSGASRDEINKVKKGKVKFQFTADAVEII